MRKLRIALACCLSISGAAFAEDQTTSSETDMTNMTTTPSAASKPPESSVKPHTYIHPTERSTGTETTGPTTMGDKPSQSLSALSESDCFITVRNDGIYDVNVYGRFDDGIYLTTYTLPWLGDYISYVSLYYNGYCHGSMEFYIERTDGTYKYNGYTPVGKTVRVK